MVMKINGLVAEFPKGEKIVEIDIDPNNENPLVTGFVDAEFGGHRDKRSVFAAQLYVNAGPVWTVSVISGKVEKSTMAAEALPMSECQDMGEWITEWLRRVNKINDGRNNLSPGKVALFGDNNSVILALNREHGIDTLVGPPHVQLKLEAVRRAIVDGEVTVAKIWTGVNPADLGTKTLPGPTNAQASALMMNDMDNYFGQRKWLTKQRNYGKVKQCTS
jgi:hypothetical protein